MLECGGDVGGSVEGGLLGFSMPPFTLLSLPSYPNTLKKFLTSLPNTSPQPSHFSPYLLHTPTHFSHLFPHLPLSYFSHTPTHFPTPFPTLFHTSPHPTPQYTFLHLLTTTGIFRISNVHWEPVDLHRVAIYLIS